MERLRCGGKIRKTPAGKGADRLSVRKLMRNKLFVFDINKWTLEAKLVGRVNLSAVGALERLGGHENKKQNHNTAQKLNICTANTMANRCYDFKWTYEVVSDTLIMCLKIT